MTLCWRNLSVSNCRSQENGILVQATACGFQEIEKRWRRTDANYKLEKVEKVDNPPPPP